MIFQNFEEDLNDVIIRWRSAGVKSLVHACVEPSEIPLIRDLADKIPELSYAVGVHPLDTKHWAVDTLKVLRESVEEDKRVVAIGEIGLDLFKDSNLEEQLQVLRPQLNLAYDLELPVIIHCRDAAEPMLAEFKKLKEINRCPIGVMHCWGGNSEEMKEFLKLGFYISFSGTVTFTKAEDIHICAKEVPDNRLLVETDCPFLSPVPLRGKRNEPSYVKHVAERVANLREQSFESVARITTANARRLFKLP